MRKILLLLFIPFFADAQISYTPYPNKSWFKDTVQFSKAMRLNFGGFGTGKVLTSDAEGRVHWATGGGTVDTLTLPFYHSITGITDTSLSWNKLTGLKDTVEFHIQGYPISNNFWSLTGNSGTNYVTNFIGTTDEQPLILKANNGGYPVAVFTNNSFSVVDSANDVDKFIVDVENSQSEFKTSLRIVDGTEGTGKVFTSDSAGYGSWQTLALTDTATLDFGNISANGHEVLTMTVTGAALSDVVSLGIPNASIDAHASFVAWVSSANTVSVKCFNFDGSNFNPAAGLFTVKVFK
jgi:hypothetical protein